ncbi:MAG: cytochrome c [Pseudolabrys sp.]
MKLSLIAAAAAVAALTATSVVAQQDPIAARKALMKEVGGATRTASQMVKGEAPFDLAKAKASLAVYQSAAAKMPDLFPATSKSGGETTAAPAIWDNMADFKAKFAKFAADAKAADAATKDLDSFKAAFGNVAKNCGGCHETYRVKKS